MPKLKRNASPNNSFLAIFLVLGLFIASPVTAEPCADGSGPESAVVGYVQGMKDYQFEAAYEFLTDNMTDGQSSEEWSELQLKFIVGGEVVIKKVDARPAHATADDAACENSAIVPHVLRAKDKFNNQGSTEFELYTVVKQNDKWLIDLQESLFDEKQIKQWFPDDEIPDYKGQL
ncbi:MAG: hypothetical protein AAF387_11710 [Pseudomonadota bacterium]